MKRLSFTLYAILSAFIMSSGCMKVGPDYERPDSGFEPPRSYVHSIEEIADPHPPDRWWQAFGDPELDQLVEKTLINNLDIKMAAARILEVRSQFLLARADRFPVINLQAQGERQSQPVVGILPGESFRNRTDIHSLSLPASFEIDLWGRLARAEEAAKADLLQAEEDRRTVAQTVVAETISLYLEMESLERRMQVTLMSIENYRRSLTLVEGRYERGLSSILDLRQARRTLARAEAGLPSLRQELGDTQNRLAVLIGRYPETRSPRLHPKDYFRLPAPVPPGLPSDLLSRRPDIRAAEARVMASSARVGMATASRFPSITLTGSFGYISEELDELIRPQSELWNIAAGLVQPLYDAGKLKAGQRAAEAIYQQNAVEYAKTVLKAFSEVENALLTRKEQLERRDRVLAFLNEARATQKVAEHRYMRGLVDYLTVLEAQQTRFQAEQDVILVDLALLINRVTLHRALGGGWAELEPVGGEEVSGPLSIFGW
ncbi:MAG: efflux transporter outer membrane subunit [Thermodesulfobacteriota bacterium]|nr:efflux transporter outer membrane subunit [Thermodesulfobacteriota bacterium]